MSSTLGFACHWGTDRRTAWSGTPFALHAALGDLVPVCDIDVTVPSRAQLVLKALATRRSAGGWHAKWRHGRGGVAAVERNLRAGVGQQRPDIVLQIGDLGRVGVPYAIVQDLSYDLLLDQFGADGVPHFRGLSSRRIRALRERQLTFYAGATRLLPMSNWLAERCVVSGTPAERIRVVNPGVNAPLDLDSPVVERRREPVRRLLFVGRDFETKAGDQVVAAFARLRAEFGPRITLTVAGPRRWPLRTVPGDGIDFLGLVPATRVQALYDSHDLFVMPSRFEGFGIAFVEALVRGLPCIGRDACAMPEIITGDDAGILVDTEEPDALAEAVVRALNDDGLYERCAAAAPRRRQFYTWRRAAEQVCNALGLVGTTPTGRRTELDEE